MLQQYPRPWSTKFKTVLCQYYDGTPTSCRFGAQCRYAHGQSEVRAKPFQAPPQPQFQNYTPNTVPLFPPADARPALFNAAPSPPPPPPPPPSHFYAPFPEFARSWAPIGSSSAPAPRPLRESKPREFTVIKLDNDFKVAHEVKFTNFTAASQFFGRALKQNETAQSIVSTFVAPNVVFAATATHAVFLTGLSVIAGKQVISEYAGRVDSGGATAASAAPSEEESQAVGAAEMN